MLLRIIVSEGSSSGDLYRFAPGLTVCIRGDRRARAYFRAEYAAVALAPGPEAPALDATIGARVHRTRVDRRNGEPNLQGTHKLARWRACMPLQPDAQRMRVAVEVRGPLGFTLVQSYILEPLVSLAAIRAGSVLLPSAAISRNGKALLLIGRSRSGKSSLAARALASGLEVLGDDQILITAGNDCLPFPRRLRVYPDLARTAPAAFAALKPGARSALAVLGRVNALTRGFVAPPVKVSASTLSGGSAPSRLPIGEVVVIRRAPVTVLTSQELDQRELAAEAEDALQGQRSEIFSLASLEAASGRLLEEERAIAASALGAAPARRISVPASWTAEEAVGALARELGLER